MHEIIDEHMLERVMSQNDEFAQHNREHFDEQNTYVINLMSAPGAGKTTLLENSVAKLSQDFSLAVIEGDMVGELDAERLRRYATNVHQICTGKSCHLDALMVGRLLHSAKIQAELLFIENVGNLVCPAEFNLGEHKRVVLLSVTEGDDKPLKYPIIFRNCDAVIFTKTDLLPYVNFNVEHANKYVRDLNANAQVFCVSAKTGEGLEDWVNWVKRNYSEHRNVLPACEHSGAGHH